MTDKEKLEKIVAYLMRRMYTHNQMADIGSIGEVFDEKIENAKYEECKDALNFIDSMQEEPVSEDLEEIAGLYGANSVHRQYYDKNGMPTGIGSELADAVIYGAKWQKHIDMGISSDAKDTIKNLLESSEPLDTYATEVSFLMLPATLTKSYHDKNRSRISDAVRLGAQWQKKKDFQDLLMSDHRVFQECYEQGKADMKEQMEANRIEHCNSITEEQYNLEAGFIDQHIDKHNRMPTFLDAIEYGMKHARKQMMESAIDGRLHDFYDSAGGEMLCTASSKEFLYKNYGLTWEDRDKIKVIIIKED